MTAPNIVDVTSITGKSYGKVLSSTTTTEILKNTDTDSVYKINTVIVCNTNGTSGLNCTASLRKNANTRFEFASTVFVPADSSMVLIGKDSPIYLEENDSIDAGGNSALTMIISYEIIS